MQSDLLLVSVPSELTYSTLRTTRVLWFKSFLNPWFLILDTRSSIPDLWYSMLYMLYCCYSKLDAQCSMLNAQCFMLYDLCLIQKFTRCLVFNAIHSLLYVLCLLLDIWCSKKHKKKKKQDKKQKELEEET